ncbi:hypothetical protein [Arthrobacter sp. efr-133-TYG-118]|uniref:hypothetical protein n=1 Tax=Arthrobacter sp. efr-133-TYG-118 TaxID=3040279 RepID=UPI00254E31D9|nr:hypothetical protein [Arthrobacter sp. efr-133-TYG-118]
MGSIVETAIETLYEARIPLGPGLTNAEIADVEQQFGIRFSADHAGLLSLGTPMGPGWVDWLGKPDGIHLAAYFAAEFFREPDMTLPTYRVDFWSDLAEGRWV